MFSDSTLKKIGCFVGGVVFGTAGVKLLSSKDAKKVYTNCTAAVLRAKDCVNEDCYNSAGERRGYPAEAQQINEKRAQERGNAGAGR
mgnify:CR=1 FL=1